MRTFIFSEIGQSQLTKRLPLVFAFVAALLLVNVSAAQTSKTLAYQGVLTDSLGNPKPDADYLFKFSLYTVATGGSAIWTETKTLSVKRGLFTTALGDVVPFPASISFKSKLWLGISVSDQAELSPRVELLAVPSSLWSQTADSAIAVADSSITSEKIRDGSIQLKDIGQNSAQVGQVIKWNGSMWNPANDSAGSGGSGGPWQVNGTDLYYSGGRVGIGTSEPNAPLSFPPWLGKKITLYPGASGDVGFGVFGNELRINSDHANADITFGYDDTLSGFTERMRVKGNGNVGIGTTAPSARLHVKGSGFPNSFGYFDTDNNGQDAGLRFYEAGVVKSHLFHHAGTNTLNLYGSSFSGISVDSIGNVGIGTFFPGGRLAVSSAGGNPQLLLHQSVGTDWSRIRLSNANTNITDRFWEVAASIGAGGVGEDRLNIYHSTAGNAFGVGGNGELYVNNNAGQPAQVLTSEGANAPAHWAPMSNIILTYYNNTGGGSPTLTNNTNYVFDSAYVFTVPYNARLAISADLGLHSVYCVACAYTTDRWWLRINGVDVHSFIYFDTQNGLTTQQSISNFMYDIGPGTYTVEFKIEHTSGTDVWAYVLNSSLMIIPR